MQLNILSPIVVTDYKFKTAPFTHQREIFLASRSAEAWALLMEQGTGKTKVAIDTAAWLKQHDKIDAVFVVCPHQMILTWTEIEFPAHTPGHIWEYSKAVPWSKKLVTQYSRSMEALFSHTDLGLRVLVINPESLIQKDAFLFCQRFLRSNRALMIVDESQSIKNPSSQRTKAVLKLKPLAAYRRVMTGTAIANNILDLYPQFAFLDEEILGYYSYYAFRNHFAVLKRMKYGAEGRPHDKVVGFRNTEELKSLVAKASSRVLKSECLDLPAKVYKTVLVDMVPKQAAAYKEMKATALLEFAPPVSQEQTVEEEYHEEWGDTVSAVHAAVKIIKLHQIASGWVKTDTKSIVPVAEPNPKLQALLGLIEDELLPDQKVVIWANYRHDIELIVQTLQSKYGLPAARAFYGGMSREDKQSVINGIQDPASALRFFVGHPAAGGSGITLTGASTVIYYSNSYNLIHRLQSEDRCHRIGQRNTVVYIDIITRGTVDTKILKALQGKVDLTKTIMKMEYRELEEFLS